MEEEFLFFKVVSFVLSAWIVIIGLRTLKSAKQKILFSASIASFFLSTVLFFEGVFIEWEKHIPFFVGEVFLYFFFQELLRTIGSASRVPIRFPKSSFDGAGTFIVFSDAAREFFNYITRQGVQHLVMLPVAFIIISSVRARVVELGVHAILPMLRPFFVGLFLFASIHGAEFFVENQGLFPSFQGTGIEILEFLLYYLAVLYFGFGLKKLKL